MEALRSSARWYVERFGWAVAPVWLNGGAECQCPLGASCPEPGKHLASGLGVAREVDDVDAIWTDDSKGIGLGVLTGSESKLLVLDVRRDAALTRARLGMHGFVHTQQSPSGGEHWFFRIGESDAILGGRTEVDLVEHAWVLGDGAFVALAPRPGYAWVGGSQVLLHDLTTPPESLMLVLTRNGLISGVARVDRDAPWRTSPGKPLLGGDPRTYTRTGDVRRLIDIAGGYLLYTPSLGWKVWTESGWEGEERAMNELRKAALDLPQLHLNEGRQSKLDGKETLSKDAFKWAGRSQQRPSSSLLGDLDTDQRVLVPNETFWDAQDHLVGLPVDDGAGRVIDLARGTILPDEENQRVLRISRRVGVTYNGESWGSIRLHAHWFPKYIADLERANGAAWVRLLQRAAGMSLYGRRRGSGANTDAIMVLKGATRSGKSTFIECLLAVAGDYAAPLDENLLFGTAGNIEYAIAGIYGARILTGSEPPDTERRALNISMLKKVTGGDSLKGRLPYGRQSISFRSEAVLWLATNRALEISDEAVWRRLKYFNFASSLDFSGKADEPRLRGALSSDPVEMRAALAWMLEGARDFAAEGWGDTTVWDEARTTEMSAFDPLTRFLDETVTWTGRSEDWFEEASLSAAFERWRMGEASDEWMAGYRKQRTELVHRIERAGFVFDPGGRLFTGGTLTTLIPGTFSRF
jgi:phage/plasmid-associated DNA primase